MGTKLHNALGLINYEAMPTMVHYGDQWEPVIPKPFLYFAYMESKCTTFFHGVHVHDHDLSNHRSTAAVSRLHLTPVTMIDSKFFYYINTVG